VLSSEVYIYIRTSNYNIHSIERVWYENKIIIVNL
jgi:hypothetical protein